MPELPEVETTRRGIAPLIAGAEVVDAVVRDHRLRWPVPGDLAAQVRGRSVRGVDRRAKYLLVRLDDRTLIIHLGMSGSLQLVPAGRESGRHDHVDVVFSGGRVLRYTDPRRFGSFHVTAGDAADHPLLARLGPEPLEPAFTGDWLHRRSRGRRQAVKAFIMDAATVVGVGNIYAAEALFRAGIHPARAAGRIGSARYRRLAEAVRQVLSDAITAGGTTLRDFVDGDGRPGYFRQSLYVYGRAGAPCPACGRPLRLIRVGQRSTCYCSRCQR
ncbi:bifunctional DNA-formamidopyrimidine glycosylase/DNA-(apurinic or apyrimidinic site) lyase [Aquisalimonas lutea]|uniref:bifunctional DNA-formamidopyrimidine glycosylase/DNA-(apurinic or apyrimidinic site) lyase n=1 Tax=Aquisalimonas lutea TaxID=1327750 RepID=UPI0025B3EA7E|nr:bifunctional DNA-formamidopyrimidine glycosylase/DNA-(apurinic or apyrimidinic site) lyase [Aquisalimonas lutea]MDN3516834.1 bifunctional DNA-formamidopyrimidine glycosylase/DNA-(apurinic or apyrimidinic site) lyase [Aquisalimonas lutea]